MEHCPKPHPVPYRTKDRGLSIRVQVYTGHKLDCQLWFGAAGFL